MNANETEIARHKTAIRRPSYSLPIKCLLRDALVHAETSVFDFGCGLGQDIELLRGSGIRCDGWDPAFRPDGEKTVADVVNLGYVINVIEDARERATAVRSAWNLSSKLLVVAAQIEFAAPDKDQTRFADGVITSRGTFQKYYTQTELREYLEGELGTDAIPAAPGIFYIFKDEATKQQFLATRYHRRIAIPRKRISELRFEQNLDVLEPLMAAMTQLGRLPGPEESPQSAQVIERFGSLNKAFALIRRVTEEQPWEDIAQRRPASRTTRCNRRPNVHRAAIGDSARAAAAWPQPPPPTAARPAGHRRDADSDRDAPAERPGQPNAAGLEPIPNAAGALASTLPGFARDRSSSRRAVYRSASRTGLPLR